MVAFRFVRLTLMSLYYCHLFCRFEFINEIFFPDRKKEEEANNAAELKKREGPITRRKMQKLIKKKVVRY